MTHSQGHLLITTILGAVGCLVFAQLTAFVTPSAPVYSSNGALRGLVSLAATPQEINAAKKDFELQKWAATHMANEASKQGTPAAQQAAAAAQTKAEQAEKVYMALKDGNAMPTMATPPVAAPVSPTVATAPAMSGAASSVPSPKEIADAKGQADLLSWAAKKLADQGAPQAGAMKARADQALQAYEALKEAKATGAPAPVAAVSSPPVAAVSSPPVAAAPAISIAASSAPNPKEVAEAKKQADLLLWAAKTLAAKGDPQAAGMQAKADQAVQAYEALKKGQSTGAPVPVATVSSPPVAAAPAISIASSSAPNPKELAEAKKQADLLLWAAKTLAAKGAPQAAGMQAKADQAVQAYEALKQAQASTPSTPVASVASAPVAAAPVAAAPVMSAAASSAPTPQELADAKEQVDMLTWVVNTLNAKGAPQAAAMQVKADQAIQVYEALKARQGQEVMAYR